VLYTVPVSNHLRFTIPSAVLLPSTSFIFFAPHVGGHLSLGARSLSIYAVQSYAHHLAFYPPRPGFACGNQDLPWMSADGHGREWGGSYRVWVGSSLPFSPLLFLNRVLEPLPSRHPSYYLVNRSFMSTASSAPSVTRGSPPTLISFSFLTASPSVQIVRTNVVSATSPSSMKPS